MNHYQEYRKEVAREYRQEYDEDDMDGDLEEMLDRSHHEDMEDRDRIDEKMALEE